MVQCLHLCCLGVKSPFIFVPHHSVIEIHELHEVKRSTDFVTLCHGVESVALFRHSFLLWTVFAPAIGAVFEVQLPVSLPMCIRGLSRLCFGGAASFSASHKTSVPLEICCGGHLVNIVLCTQEISQMADRLESAWKRQ